MCEKVNVQVSKPARKCQHGERPSSHSNNSYHGSVGSLLRRAKQARDQNNVPEANRLGYHYRKKCKTSCTTHSRYLPYHNTLSELQAHLGRRRSLLKQGAGKVQRFRIKGPKGTVVGFYRGVRPINNTQVHLKEAKEALSDLDLSAFSFANNAWTDYQSVAVVGTRLMQSDYRYNRGSFGWNVPVDGFPRSSFVNGQDLTPPKFVKSSKPPSKEVCLHVSDKNLPLLQVREFYWNFSMGYFDIDMKKPHDETEPYDFTWEERHTIDPYVRWLPDGSALVKLEAGTDSYLDDSRKALRELLGRIHRFTSQTFIGDFIVANLPEFYPRREIDPCDVEFDLNTDLERFWQNCGTDPRFEEVYYGKVLDVIDRLIDEHPPSVDGVLTPRTFLHTPLIRNSTFAEPEVWSRYEYKKPIIPF